VDGTEVQILQVHTLHSLGLQGGSMEPALHVLACCQGHCHHSDVSHDPDVMEMVFHDVIKEPRCVCLCTSAKVTIIMVTSSSNPDVTSSTIAQYMLWGQSTVHNPIN